jgi:uncharacterized SAM-binding protein YcdF (DUF218 family)
MFFIFSKIFFFLLSPGLWIAGLLLFAYFKRRKRYAKKMAIIALVLFIIFSNEFIFKKAFYAWQINKSTVKANTVYTGILLGGMISFDRDLQPFFNYHADRFIQTLRLYNQRKIAKIIITAGSGSLTRTNLNEASILRNEFRMNGVPDSAIIIDSKSRNTDENARYTKKILDSLRIPPPYLLITSARHIRRAQAVFTHQGIAVDVFPSAFDVRRDAIGMNSFIPQFYVLASWQDLLKEIVGFAAYKITGKA